MNKKRLLLFAGALALALALGLYVKSAQAAPVHRTSVVINDYVYDNHSVNWVNVNTYQRGLECRRASIILFDMIEEGYAVEFTGPISCPYTVSYSVYHGQQVYRRGFNTTYRLRFNRIHTNLWINHVYTGHGHRVFRPYFQSTVRVLKPRVQYRHTHNGHAHRHHAPGKTVRAKSKHNRRHKVSPNRHKSNRQGATRPSNRPNHRHKMKNKGKRKSHQGKQRLAHRRR